MFTKIFTIIRAKLRNKEPLRQEEWYQKRLDACGSCYFNSKNNTERGFIYWFWDILNFKKPYCTICKCEIEAKASEELEECSNKDNKQWHKIKL